MTQELREELREVLKETRSNACDKRYGFTIDQAIEKIEKLAVEQLQVEIKELKSKPELVELDKEEVERMLDKHYGLYEKNTGIAQAIHSRFGSKPKEDLTEDEMEKIIDNYGSSRLMTRSARMLIAHALIKARDKKRES